MINLFNIIKKRKSVKINEEKLYKKFGDCRKIQNNINLLIITDTHGLLVHSSSLIDKIRNARNYDLCCVLGDVTYSDYEVILQYVPKEKIVGILGNHDEFEILRHYGINDLNGKIVTINGIRIGGIQGCYKYKNANFPSFTHEESVQFLNQMEPVDILLSHTGPLTAESSNDVVHSGLQGITEYLYKNKIPYNIHGHDHSTYNFKLKNGTQVLGTYLIEQITIDKKNKNDIL